jgi:chromosome segregation ATPase
MKNYLPLLFVIIAIGILIFLSRQREAMTTNDDTLVRLNKLETTDKEVENRLSIVEKELRTAKEEQTKAEAQVNAGIGEIQAIT